MRLSCDGGWGCGESGGKCVQPEDGTLVRTEYSDPLGKYENEGVRERSGCESEFEIESTAGTGGISY